MTKSLTNIIRLNAIIKGTPKHSRNPDETLRVVDAAGHKINRKTTRGGHSPRHSINGGHESPTADDDGWGGVRQPGRKLESFGGGGGGGIGRKMSGKRGAPATHSRVQGMLQTLGGKITDAGLHLIDDFARLEEGVEDVLDGEDYFGIDEDESTGEFGIDEDESRHHVHVVVLFDHVMPCDSTLSLSLSLHTPTFFLIFSFSEL